MERADILERLERDPFQPFFVLTADGRRYEVRNPMMAMPLRTRLFLALPPRPGEAPDRAVELSLRHVVGIEELQES